MSIGEQEKSAGPSEAAVMVTVVALAGSGFLMKAGSLPAFGSVVGLLVAFIGLIAGSVLLSGRVGGRRPSLVLTLVLGIAMAAAVLRAALLIVT
ncbi:hypothetical protein N8J89_23955 [Crossiella sp. CA-258035]|uniref:hypothetical protein n=1 Tax=Crossiella sp. CA-258035 TaxID=2981138 RepID=UPI0024BD56A9|nr:hypothetical protein [Crossiella sp. CA-258035]WHT16184.1 hypothetical protein N8J89_23955 [Crossiella sp. CA-258035]